MNFFVKLQKAILRRSNFFFFLIDIGLKVNVWGSLDKTSFATFELNAGEEGKMCSLLDHKTPTVSFACKIQKCLVV